MKQIAFLLAVLVCLSLTVIPQASAEEAGDLQLLSCYYNMNTQTGLLGQIAPGTTAEDLFSRLFASDVLSLSNGVATGSSLSVGTTPCMTLVVQADCNGDGAYSVTDMLMVKSKILGQQEFSDAQLQAGDVTGDGDVTITDFLQMKSQLLGLLEFSLRPVDGAAQAPGILLTPGQTASYGAAGDSVTVEGSAAGWAEGVITANTLGTARLTNGSDTMLVTVCREGLQVSLPGDVVSLKPNETFQLQPVLNHPMDSRITYTVSDSAVATVSETGLITAVGKGTATVTATLPNGHSDSQDITVRNRFTVCIDAGHQYKANYAKEPIGPGSKTMKTALSGGTRGVVTKIYEAELNLVIALMLKDELIARGYDVVMTRETEVCPMTNSERAIFASQSGADIYVRIHADGSDITTKHGAFTCAPSKRNPFLTDENIAASRELSQVMVDAFCERTGAKNRGIFETDNLTGCNWCTIPSTVIEMGFMSNPDEDRKMATDAYRQLMMLGIADGIDAYFADK